MQGSLPAAAQVVLWQVLPSKAQEVLVGWAAVLVVAVLQG
jgi:hypothetical protein